MQLQPDQPPVQIHVQTQSVYKVLHGVYVQSFPVSQQSESRVQPQG